MIELVTKNEFELAYRRAMYRGGHGYDDWDVAMNWKGYQEDPSKYGWVFEEGKDNE